MATFDRSIIFIENMREYELLTDEEANFLLNYRRGSRIGSLYLNNILGYLNDIYLEIDSGNPCTDPTFWIKYDNVGIKISNTNNDTNLVLDNTMYLYVRRVFNRIIDKFGFDNFPRKPFDNFQGYRYRW